MDGRTLVGAETPAMPQTWVVAVIEARVRGILGLRVHLRLARLGAFQLWNSTASVFAAHCQLETAVQRDDLVGRE